MTKNILFVCTGNSCRSVIAEGLFRRAVAGRQKDFIVGSAGVAALDGYPPTLETVRVLRDEGIDMSEHKSRRLTDPLAQAADFIYVMEKMHRDLIAERWPENKAKVHLLTEFSPVAGDREQKADVPDPIQMSDEFYRQTLKMIDGCIKKIAETF